jgi:hypothetical protein
MAESALIMTVPCHLGRFGPVLFVASCVCLSKQAPFQEVVVGRQSGFVPPAVCFVL